MNEYQSDANQDFRDYQADEYEQLQKGVPRGQGSTPRPLWHSKEKEIEALNE